jgi:hypothetical protein
MRVVLTAWQPAMQSFTTGCESSTIVTALVPPRRRAGIA